MNYRKMLWQKRKHPPRKKGALLTTKQSWYLYSLNVDKLLDRYFHTASTPDIPFSKTGNTLPFQRKK